MANSVYTNNNTFIVVQRDITSSTIKTATDLNVFETIWNWLIVEEVILRTDATGLAWWTAMQLKADWIVFYSTAVSWLWASAIKDVKNASVTWSKATILAGTKYITVNSTVADCTWAWVVTVVLICRKIDSNSLVNPI